VPRSADVAAIAADAVVWGWPVTFAKYGLGAGFRRCVRGRLIWLLQTTVALVPAAKEPSVVRGTDALGIEALYDAHGALCYRLAQRIVADEHLAQDVVLLNRPRRSV